MKTKQELLNEIRRCVRENGGETPSEKVFYEVGGVGIYDLNKLGWTNYGDFVQDAGLSANKFDNTKYTHEQMCQFFIEVIREKGRWPTRGVLEVKHHNNQNFPASSTFYKRLGLTKNLAKTIIEFAYDKQRYDDVVEICNPILGRFEDKEESSEEGVLTRGFVYLGKQHGDFKIGTTKDLHRRREDITLQGSEPFVLIHQIETDDMFGVEKYWHNRFKSKLKRGEWFKLCSADVKSFKHWKKII